MRLSIFGGLGDGDRSILDNISLTWTAAATPTYNALPVAPSTCQGVACVGLSLGFCSAFVWSCCPRYPHPFLAACCSTDFHHDCVSPHPLPGLYLDQLHRPSRFLLVSPPCLWCASIGVTRHERAGGFWCRCLWSCPSCQCVRALGP